MGQADWTIYETRVFGPPLAGLRLPGPETFPRPKIILPKIHKDFRGSYTEIYSEATYYNMGVNMKFVQDDLSISERNVLRGIHGDIQTWKLVQCVYGRMYEVIVDLRKGSPTYLKWESFILSPDDRMQILIPPGFGNSVLSLQDGSVYHYKQSTYYERESQFTYRWDDPTLNIFWPIQNPILSERDRDAKFLEL